MSDPPHHTSAEHHLDPVETFPSILWYPLLALGNQYLLSQQSLVRNYCFFDYRPLEKDHFQRFMDKTGRTGTRAQLINGGFLLGSFLFIRIVYGGYIVRLRYLLAIKQCSFDPSSPYNFSLLWFKVVTAYLSHTLSSTALETSFFKDSTGFGLSSAWLRILYNTHYHHL